MTLHNEELEKLTIGRVMVRGTMSVDERILSTQDFHFFPHQQFWGAICELDEENEPMDVIEVHRRSKTSWKISDVLSLTQGIPSTARREDVKHLRDLATARKLRGVLAELSEKLESSELKDVLDDAEHALAVIKKDSGIEIEGVKRIGEVMEYDVFPKLDQFVSGETVKLPFGFNPLDVSTNGGVGLGELVILGAKPKSGKSALTLQIAKWQTYSEIPALIVSREMLNFENGFRAIAQDSQYSNNVFRPNLMEGTAERLKEVGRAMSHLPLFLDDRSKKVSEIRRHAKMLKETDGLKSVFVDYAQLMRPEVKRNTRADDLEQVYYDLKDLAQELELAVYVNAQFNRTGIKSDRPTMSDFDGSSAAEKAGNLIILWNLEDEKTINNTKRGKLWIEAGRNVATDEFEIEFDGAHSRFIIT